MIDYHDINDRINRYNKFINIQFDGKLVHLTNFMDKYLENYKLVMTYFKPGELIINKESYYEPNKLISNSHGLYKLKTSKIIYKDIYIKLNELKKAGKLPVKMI
jgi:hypothetical protein